MGAQSKPTTHLHLLTTVPPNHHTTHNSFVVVGDGAILEAVGSFEGVRYNELPRGAYFLVLFFCGGGRDHSSMCACAAPAAGVNHTYIHTCIHACMRIESPIHPPIHTYTTY